MRLYVLCKSWEWNHLPVMGGIYDQSPKLLDDFYIIHSIEVQVERDKKAKEARSNRRKPAASRSGGGRGRRR